MNKVVMAEILDKLTFIKFFDQMINTVYLSDLLFLSRNKIVLFIAQTVENPGNLGRE